MGPDDEYCGQVNCDWWMISILTSDVQVKYDPATGEPNWDQMGEENVIANMTMCGIVGIEVRKTFIKHKFFEILTLTSK